MRTNSIKQKIKSGESVFGTFVKCADPAVVEVLALAGLDFFVLDNEHVAMDRGQITHMLRAAEAFDITPLIRVRENRAVEILQSLDLGYAGVQVPNVDTEEQGRALVDGVKYQPLGARGFSPSVRAARYATMNIADYIRMANENTLVVAHCETKASVDNLGGILGVPGLDVIFIGPMDLSQSLGLAGDLDAPLVRETIDRAFSQIKASDKAAGTVAGNAGAARALVERGYQYILIGSDLGMISSWAKAAMAELKGKRA